MITVCSGFSPLGLVEYGRKFLDTFDQYWDEDIRLAVYVEDYVDMPRNACKNLWLCEGARDFYNRHRDDRRRSGREPIRGWRQKDRVEGYAWRFDALKFFKQCVIPYDVSKSLADDDILVWLDADVVTFRHVPKEFLFDLIKDTDLIYFGRGSYHSEIGFWAVRMCKAGRAMVQELAEVYTSDRFLQLEEHHSAFVFDYVKRAFGLLRTRNLTPGGNGHVWLKSPLAIYTDHLKGSRRKRIGHSLDHPIKWWK